MQKPTPNFRIELPPKIESFEEFVAVLEPLIQSLDRYLQNEQCSLQPFNNDVTSIFILLSYHLIFQKLERMKKKLITAQNLNLIHAELCISQEH